MKIYTAIKVPEIEMSTSLDPPLENEGHESLVLLADAEQRREAKAASAAAAVKANAALDPDR